MSDHDTNDVALTSDGKPLPYTPAEVRAIVDRAVADGKLRAVIAEMLDGSLAVLVLGDPSAELVGVLQQAADAYRHFLKGQ